MSNLLFNMTHIKGKERDMMTRQERKERIKSFFQSLTPKELDEMLERNGIDNVETKEESLYYKAYLDVSRRYKNTNRKGNEDYSNSSNLNKAA